MNELVRLGLTQIDETFASPPDFDPRALGGLPAAAVAQYERDGVVCLRRVADRALVDRLRADSDRAAAEPKGIHMRLGGGPDDPRFFFFEYQLQERFESFRELIWKTAVPDYTLALLRSKTLGLYYTNTFVKEGGAVNKVTPWHQDGGYSRVRGRNVTNFYVVLDPMPAATTVRFIQGSHAPGLEYRPVDDDWSAIPENPLAYRQVPHPPMSRLRAAGATIGWPLEPGDALVFSQFTMHGAPGNSLPTRRHAVALVLAGDDVAYDAAPGLTNPPFTDPALKDGAVPWGEVFPRLR
jgi:ectoine hydroxylase-related dioxygenase (phytanoyl-CoA dioxygenase family)